MMKIKTQSPVYVNKKEVRNGDFYVGADGKTKPLAKQPPTAKPGQKKGGKLDSLLNKGILSDTLGKVGKNLGDKKKVVVPNSTTIITEKEKDKEPMSTGMKVAIAGGVVLVIGVIWYMNRKK